VGGLDEKVDEETLQGVFQPFGELVTIIVPRDQGQRRHRGFGFVEFEDPEDAKHAMENMQDSELYGRVIKCNIAKPNALKAKAVWDDADKWYEKHLHADADSVDQEIRHKDATDKTTENKDGPEKKDEVKVPIQDSKETKENKSRTPGDNKNSNEGGNAGGKKRKRGKGKQPEIDPKTGKQKPKTTVSFEDVFGRYFIYT